MNVHSWFVYIAVQLTSKMSFRTRKNFLAQQLKEENERIKGIQQKSAKEIEYLSKFTHWPIAQAKQEIDPPMTSVIQLNSNAVAEQVVSSDGVGSEIKDVHASQERKVSH